MLSSDTIKSSCHLKIKAVRESEAVRLIPELSMGRRSMR
jgi:hypothetical protein